MKLTKQVRKFSIVSGVSLLVAASLLVAMTPTRSLADTHAPLPSSIAESTIAPAEQLGKAFAAVAAQIRPAVVSVYSEKMLKYRSGETPFPFGDPFFRQFLGPQFHAPQQHRQFKEFEVPQRGMGSGMILDAHGDILTNYHVVKGVDKINVKLADGRSFKARIVGTDPATDVAVIRIEGKVPADLPTVRLGNSDAEQVGNLVMAVGAPFGLTQTVTTGIISAKGRSDVGVADYEDFLQTDAPINPGNSGGPLVNMRGEVIGMNSAIETNVGQFAGVGFAIPVNIIKAMLPRLIKGEKITRGLLGVVIQDITPDLASQFHLSDTNGALVAQVNPDSAASRAGIRAGDVITAYDGKEVAGTSELRNLVAATAPGTKVGIDIVRDGKPQTITAVIGKLTAEAAESGIVPGATGGELGKLGLTGRTLTPELAGQSNLTGDKGVLITSVEPGSVASLAGLRAGDLITQADKQPVASVGGLRKVLAKAGDKKGVLLLIKRHGASMFVYLSKP